MQHATAAGVPVGASTLRELSPAPPVSEPGARQLQQPQAVAAPGATAAAATTPQPAGDPEGEAILLLAPLACAAAAGELARAADGAGLVQQVAGSSEQLSAAADAATPGVRGLLAALRGDAAPSSSSEDPAIAEAALAAGQAPSPQKTTASAPAAAGCSSQDAEQQQQQQEDADGRPAGVQPAFAFPQLEHPSQQGHAAATPALPVDPTPQAAAAPAPAGQGSGGGSGGGGGGGCGGSLVGSPEAVLAAAEPAAWPAGEGKENLTGSQSNSQEQVGLQPATADAVSAGKQLGAQEGSGVARLPQAGQAGAAGAAQPACMVPDSEEQTLPGTQPLGEGSQQPLPLAAAAPAGQAADGCAQHAQQPSPKQHRLQQEPPAGAAAAQAMSAGAPTTQGASCQTTQSRPCRSSCSVPPVDLPAWYQ